MKKLFLMILSGFALLLSVAGETFADANIGGNINYRLISGKELIYNSDLSLKVSLENNFTDSMYFYSDINILSNSDTKEVLRVEPAETYFRFYPKDNLSITVGNQVILWGRADGFNPTNVLIPEDTGRRFTATYYADRFLPGQIIKGQIFSDLYNLQFVVIPVFRENILPSADSPWYPLFLRNIKEHVKAGKAVLAQGIKPETTLGNMQVGAKIDFYPDCFEFSLSGFSGFTKDPVYYQKLLADGRVEYLPEYKRQSVFGFDYSFPFLEKYTFWGECALKRPVYLLVSENYVTKVIEKNKLEVVTGFDTYHLNDKLYLNTQILYEYIMNHEKNLSAEETTWGMAVQAEYSFLDGNLVFGTFALWADIGNKQAERDLFVKPQVEYKFDDGLIINLSRTFFQGDSSGPIGQYDGNDLYSLEFEYSF